MIDVLSLPHIQQGRTARAACEAGNYFLVRHPNGKTELNYPQAQTPEEAVALYALTPHDEFHAVNPGMVFAVVKVLDSKIGCRLVQTQAPYTFPG